MKRDLVIRKDNYRDISIFFTVNFIYELTLPINYYGNGDNADQDQQRFN